MSDFRSALKWIGIIILICLLMIVLGTMIGYGIGGGNPFQVFVPSTWTHIFDFLR